MRIRGVYSRVGCAAYVGAPWKHQRMTLAIAIAGFLLAVISLSWQVWTFRASGARVKVTTGTAIPVGGAGHIPPQLQITAVNAGRGPASIVRFGLELPDGGSIAATRPSPLASSSLPARLEGQSSANFFLDNAECHEEFDRRGVPLNQVRPYVDLATGGRVYGPALRGRAS